MFQVLFSTYNTRPPSWLRNPSPGRPECLTPAGSVGSVSQALYRTLEILYVYVYMFMCRRGACL